MNKIHRLDTEFINIFENSSTVKTLRIKVPDDFIFTAGQFVNLLIDNNGKIVKKPYSIASSPLKKGYVELCVKRVDSGFGSNWLHQRKKGDTVKVMGPLGVFQIEDRSKNNDIIFIATGTGISPFRGMIHDLLNNGFDKKIILLKGVRYEDERLFCDEFDDLGQEFNNLECHDCVSQPRNDDYQGEKGRVQELIKKYVPQDFKGDFYICGLFAMISDVSELLQEMGVEKERIHFERYD